MFRAYFKHWRNASDTKGKTRRLEFFLAEILNFIIGITSGLGVLLAVYLGLHYEQFDGAIIYIFFAVVFTFIYVCASINPSNSIKVRRLRDSGYDVETLTNPTIEGIKFEIPFWYYLSPSVSALEKRKKTKSSAIN